MDAIPTADIVLYSIIGFIIIEKLLEIYILMRQVKVYKSVLTVPDELKHCMSEETFHKARLYELDSVKFDILKKLLVDIVLICLELYFGVIALLWQVSINLVDCWCLNVENEIIVSSMFTTLYVVINFNKDMPFKLYKTFVLEEKHGFNKQTPLSFVGDQFKNLVLLLALTPITAATTFIVQHGGENFFIWLWLFSCVVTVASITIYPAFFQFFDTYTPLEAGALRQSIEELAASLKFPLTDIHVVDGSKKSSHSNIYFTGFWNFQRILIIDTLLLNKGKPADSADLKEEEKGKGCTDEEVIAVLGHELGHWKLGHITKTMIIMQIYLFVMFAIFGYLFCYALIYEAVGFQPCKYPVIVGLLVIFSYVMAPLDPLMIFAMKTLSRRFEYQADEFARQLGFGEQLKHALIKIQLDHLGFPVYDWLYSTWSHTHPTLLERLKRLKESEEAETKKSN